MKKHIEHKDPARFPKLQLPIEKQVEKQFPQMMNSLIVDITKIMVKQVKTK